MFTVMKQALRPCLGSMETSTALNIKKVSKVIETDEKCTFLTGKKEQLNLFGYASGVLDHTTRIFQC